MKALLICPSESEPVAALAEIAPLANVSLLGKSLIEYWIEHLVTLGANEIHIATADRPNQVEALVGDGARWGIRLVTHREVRDLTPAEARAKYQRRDASWLPAPHDANVLDCLPGLPSLPLLISYANWFAAAQAWLPRAATPDRIGVREIQPGVLAGLHARISPRAGLQPPCWIGDEVCIGAEARIGPNAVIEHYAFVERGAEVSDSIIGPETFVGRFTEVRGSIAWGDTLINWRRNSCVRVPDAFLLCSLERRVSAEHLFPNWYHHIASAVTALMPFTRFRGPTNGLLGPALSEDHRSQLSWTSTSTTEP